MNEKNQPAKHVSKPSTPEKKPVSTAKPATPASKPNAPKKG